MLVQGPPPPEEELEEDSLDAEAWGTSGDDASGPVAALPRRTLPAAAAAAGSGAGAGCGKAGAAASVRGAAATGAAGAQLKDLGGGQGGDLRQRGRGRKRGGKAGLGYGDVTTSSFSATARGRDRAPHAFSSRRDQGVPPMSQKEVWVLGDALPLVAVPEGDGFEVSAPRKVSSLRDHPQQACMATCTAPRCTAGGPLLLPGCSGPGWRPRAAGPHPLAHAPGGTLVSPFFVAYGISWDTGGMEGGTGPFDLPIPPHADPHACTPPQVHPGRQGLPV